MEMILNKLETWEKTSQKQFDDEMDKMEKYFKNAAKVIRSRGDGLSEL